LLGGGGITGSAVGDTGSSRGMTVYRLTGWPICPIAIPPHDPGSEGDRGTGDIQEKPARITNRSE